ncbi:MAG: hypothetical protein AAGD14_06640 [Planctomycetota bacterium]
MARAGWLILYLLALTVVTSAGPVRKAPIGSPAGADLLFFERYLAKGLHDKCASCHSDPESAGRYLLQPLDDAARPDHRTLLANYRATLGFLDADAPERSAQLRKPQGADAHGGGALLDETNSDFYEHLLHFAMGATLDNRPPEAILPRRITARVGRASDLDGTLSGDPDGSPIRYAWRVAERPVGSEATLEPDGDGGATFTPDVAGPFRIELMVHDGRLGSLRASMLVVAERTPRSPSRAFTPEPTKAKRDEAPQRAFLERRLDPARLQLIRRLFLDLKWRTPRIDEIERWYDVPHEKMVAAFLEDAETWNTWYEQQLYYFLLLDRFRPKQGRTTTLPIRLAKRQVTASIALREIVGSTYFGQRNPGNDTFCTVVLEQCLGLVVQERRNLRTLKESKKMYDGLKAKIFGQKGSSQFDFVAICFAQELASQHLLRRTWKDLHGTDIPEKTLEADAAKLHADPKAFPAILQAWLTGPAYVGGVEQTRTKPEIPYVRGLFMDALGRVPTYEELRNVRNAFLSLADPTPIRLVMGRVLLESPQARMPSSALNARRFVQEQFVRLFARAPSGRELATFTESLKNDPSVTPRVVLWTLISSPEYQTY